MAYWSGTLFSGAGVSSTVFTGISTDALANMPRGVLTRAVYAGRFIGGASGSVGIRIFGAIGGITMVIAARTSVSAPAQNTPFEIWGSLGGSSNCWSTRPTLVEVGPTLNASSWALLISSSMQTD